MADSEILDTDPAIGLGCALESFTEYEEVKGKTPSYIRVGIHKIVYKLLLMVLFLLRVLHPMKRPVSNLCHCQKKTTLP
jgi:hypothetical protein